jgi:hypothetical protein
MIAPGFPGGYERVRVPVGVLADDVVAVVEHVAALDAAEGRGAWIAPLAATRSERVRAVVSTARTTSGRRSTRASRRLFECLG